ncbi:MAG: Unknown protein [uncultured Thiotrichaceae bacterium]|uniref:Uncharacterized protein n=1 Tax=uncultured Thiotrichaceae bacterium TaxID=298394 RepID=A0A6S6T4R5_9GAMM|nr:MAG: Unknown protein [uncultured Thiotrichaceae bacterium]
MKNLILLSSLSGLLCACSSIPVPVNPGIVIPNLLPKNPMTNYVPQADPFMTQPNIAGTSPQRSNTPAAPAIIAAAPTSTLAIAKAIPASYSPAPIPAVTLPLAHPVSNKTAAPPKIITPANTVSTPQKGRLQNLSWLSGRILKNQTAGNPEKLINWNERGNFVTLGIGHFIWYPSNKKGQYNESFPVFLNYAKANGAQLPAWLANQYQEGAPWSNSATFARARNDPQVRELHAFMNKTLNLQANFMMARLKQTLPAMLQNLPPNERQRVQNNYLTVERSPGGIYPLLDYIQFKGSGINPAERYSGQGWGLLQVLQEMQTVKPGSAALAEFRRSADDVLIRRIANAPADKREARLLSQWLDRISTYNLGKSG